MLSLFHIYFYIYNLNIILNYGTKLCSDFRLILNKCEFAKKLAKIAKIVLSVPETQFESERNFSISGRTLEDLY